MMFGADCTTDRLLTLAFHCQGVKIVLTKFEVDWMKSAGGVY